MKIKVLVAIFALTISSPAFSQKKSDLIKTNKALVDSVSTLNSKMSEKDNEIAILRSQLAEIAYIISKSSNEVTSTNTTIPAISTNQCKATTQKGSQCTRNAQEGSEYCWQHSSGSSSSSSYKSSSHGSSSKSIHTGPRGGKYYINSKGNKTYVKRK